MTRTPRERRFPMSKIKFSPATGEIEVEGSEAFVKKYMKILQGLVSEPKKGTKGKTVGKVAAVAKTRPARGSISNSILSVVKKNDQGLSVKDIIKKTKLTVSQINPVIQKALKEGKIRRIGRGIYGF
jgi:hypothetical protein